MSAADATPKGVGGRSGTLRPSKRSGILTLYLLPFSGAASLRFLCLSFFLDFVRFGAATNCGVSALCGAGRPLEDALRVMAGAAPRPSPPPSRGDDAAARCLRPGFAVFSAAVFVSAAFFVSAGAERAASEGAPPRGGPEGPASSSRAAPCFWSLFVGGAPSRRCGPNAAGFGIYFFWFVFRERNGEIALIAHHFYNFDKFYPPRCRRHRGRPSSGRLLFARRPLLVLILLSLGGGRGVGAVGGFVVDTVSFLLVTNL